MIALLHLVPVLLVLVLLWRGRYPGERRILALAARRRATRHAAVGRRSWHGSLPLLPRGGALIARALAGRAPPAPLPV